KNPARFEREIEALQSVDHPNVVHLLDAGVQGDQRYMVMDYIEGTDLTHYIRDHGAFEPEAAHAIASQIGAALSYIHERGQVHRDVTSGNIMISGETDALRAVLMDFGLVKLIDRPTNITMSGDVMGTIDYMSPEQIIQTQ